MRCVAQQAQAQAGAGAPVLSLSLLVLLAPAPDPDQDLHPAQDQAQARRGGGLARPPLPRSLLLLPRSLLLLPPQLPLQHMAALRAAPRLQWWRQRQMPKQWRQQLLRRWRASRCTRT